MSGAATYEVPTGPLRLAGPIVRPEPGTLPLRGDLAHIALAGTHLAAHYVIPHSRQITCESAVMHLTSRDDSEEVMSLEAGTNVEVLDVSGVWSWVCMGPDGPSGYVKGDCLGD